MIPKENPEEFYSRFREQLTESQEWPGPYLFKFILRKEFSRLEDLKTVFAHMDAQFKLKESAKKNFISLSVLTQVSSADQVIELYKQVKTFEGVISL